ncbi:SDR family oxidoreductase [Candidatus Pacearchaeota archaeon]|nr:SDR family oxidoreductase [Candidatus Pacearchaeota archaeon]
MEYTPPNYGEDFDGKVAIVTGAASGIGKAIAKALAHHGANICLFDKVFKESFEPSEEIEMTAEYADSYDLDVSNKKGVKKCVESVVKNHGVPWILVNNAGIEYNDRGNLITMPDEDMDRILNTNLKGYVNMLRAVVPYMVENGGGRIVNISSVQAIQSCKPGTIYQVTKQGILALARVMSIEYARHNIRTNTIIPGKIKTEGMGNVRIDKNSHALDDLLKSTPMGRGGHPEEVAQAVLFLLSESSSYINGAELIVDGGLTNTLVGDMGVPEIPVANDPDRN